MSEEELKRHVNPYSLLTDPVDIFDAVAVPVPPGTKAPPRPPGKERTASELPVTEPFEIFTEQAIPLPPGTKAPARPPGKEQIPAPDQGHVAALIIRIESALDAIHAALAEIKQIQSKAG